MALFLPSVRTQGWNTTCHYVNKAYRGAIFKSLNVETEVIVTQIVDVRVDN